MANSAEGPGKSTRTNNRWARIATMVMQQTGKEVQAKQTAKLYTKPKMEKKNG